jgi:hypothetical protein
MRDGRITAVTPSSFSANPNRVPLRVIVELCHQALHSLATRRLCGRSEVT